MAVSATAITASISCALLSIYFNWRKQKRNADVSHLCIYPAIIVYFLLNGSPTIFKILVILSGVTAFALGLYRLRNPA